MACNAEKEQKERAGERRTATIEAEGLGGTAFAEIFSPLVFTSSRSRDGGSLRVVELYLEFYKVLNKTQSLYNPIFIQEFVLTKFPLDYPLAPSVTFGDSSLPEGAEGNGGRSKPLPYGEQRRLRTLPTMPL